MMKNISITLLALLFLTSCGGESKKTKTESAPIEEAKSEGVCKYQFVPDATKVLWVAYKYTERTGVKGGFTDVSITNTTDADSPVEVFNKAEISIKTTSVNSGDPTRDPKIVESFFGSMEMNETITGKVLSVKGSDDEGEMTLEMTMNGQTNQVPASYFVKHDVLEVQAEINVADWSALPGIDALNKVCEDLHKGADGESILWPEVSIFISSKLNKDCGEVASLD